jgi:hypothetical protein
MTRAADQLECLLQQHNAWVAPLRIARRRYLAIDPVHTCIIALVISASAFGKSSEAS